jgi:hypothetical protein
VALLSMALLASSVSAAAEAHAARGRTAAGEIMRQPVFLVAAPRARWALA